MPQLFQSFQCDISGIPIPELFTFPFYYEPHPLSTIAAEALQQYLETQTDFDHNFGLDPKQTGLSIGKMFGVLVVQNKKGELGYLWAYSGKLAESNLWEYFVPTVFDMLQENSYFKEEEVSINALTIKLAEIEKSELYITASRKVQEIKQQAEKGLIEQKTKIKEGKVARNIIRQSTTDIKVLEALNLDSQEASILLKKMTQYWDYKIKEAQQGVAQFELELEALKEARKTKSAALQQRLFEEYAFLNQHHELKSLGVIFDGNPPAGAGECAAPKLIHYAFQQGLKPIAMAEFWWGQSPKSEVRKHKQYYPACMGKCEPILKHMLFDLPMEPNPFERNDAANKTLEIVYEDDCMVIVNKPTELLSVPGKQIKDSVFTRVQQLYPEATGPLLVHRLDMATSGLLVVAKSSEIHKIVQSQFIKRQIKKRYVALLDGIVQKNSGTIDLPLRVDLDNRPNQLVCYVYGKKARTQYEVVGRKNNTTLVYFYPITGRTHQLRVHAAHSNGLNCPIVGDDLYGTKSNRLHLHAESITFQHPITLEMMTISVAPDF
jgi:tRNA pseudouridine32 synthase/23S rRNA pseudouridine746 synthase